MTVWESVSPLTDEPQDAAFWEPWTPKVGDRVRVRLNGECPVRKLEPDTDKFDGTDGKVFAILTVGPNLPSHRVGVELDTCPTCIATGLCGHYASAGELEPLP